MAMLMGPRRVKSKDRCIHRRLSKSRFSQGVESCKWPGPSRAVRPPQKEKMPWVIRKPSKPRNEALISHGFAATWCIRRALAVSHPLRSQQQSQC